MGQIVGAAIVSHHPGLMRSEAQRLALGDGHDTDLIPGFARIRSKIDLLDADTFVIFDTHWITTAMNLVAGRAHYQGIPTKWATPQPYPMFRARPLRGSRTISHTHCDSQIGGRQPASA